MKQLHDNTDTESAFCRLIDIQSKITVEDKNNHILPGEKDSGVLLAVNPAADSSGAAWRL